MLEMMRRKDDRGRFVPFDVRLVHCNKTKRTGGQLVDYAAVTLPKRDSMQIGQALVNNATKSTTGKSPNHMLHGTINFLFASGEIRKGHIGLITRFNGMKVI
jgi:hypothetical protein